MKDSVVVGNVDDHCEKNDNYSAIVHPTWMMNTLVDIDKARRCTALAVRYKNL